MFGNTYSCLFAMYVLSFSSVCDVFVRCLVEYNYVESALVGFNERGIHIFMFACCVRS